jgi:transposase
MRKIREILRLAWSCNQSRQAIATSCGIGKTTVTDTLYRASAAKLSWPLPFVLDDEGLETLLYPTKHSSSHRKCTQPDWHALNSELVTHKNLTLMLLWQEYKEGDPSGYQYSQFCDLFRNWKKTLDLSMRQEHRAGEKLFVDYCGQTIPIVDASTGEVRDAQVFVAVMGTSNYTYAEATWSQSLPDWTGSHVRTFSFLGCLPKCVVPDNLRSAVTKTCRYEPDINPTYAALAAHYGVAVMPARVRKPKDKAKAEVGVQIVQRFILAGLRKRTFFTLAEANAAIKERLALLNNRAFRKLPGTRTSRFEELDRPAMLPLPATGYQYAQFKKVRLNINYHFELEGHFYSAPHRLVREQLDIRYTEATVECLHKGQRVASHAKSTVQGGYTTTPEHMPKAHREYAEWTPQRLISWAAGTGKATAQVVESILSRKVFPEHGFNSCLGIISLGKRYSKERLEAACERALYIKGVNYKSIKSILENNLDQKPLPKQLELLPVSHENIRGTDYYNDERKQHADTTNHREVELHEAHRHGQSLCGPVAMPGHGAPLL